MNYLARVYNFSVITYLSEKKSSVSELTVKALLPKKMASYNVIFIEQRIFD